MAHYKSYQELETYKLAREICKDVLELIISTPLGNDFKFRDQINGSSASIIDNIAEGFGRGGNREFINFLSYSRGSGSETQLQLIRALDRKHIPQEAFDSLFEKTQIQIDQLSKFMNYLKNSDRNGPKFD